MRYSKQKDVIHNILKGTDKHPNADSIYALAKNNVPNLSLGTVYRNLKALSVSGEVAAININGITHYDANTSPHSHFYCAKCKNLFDTNFKSDGAKNLEENGFSVHSEEILMTGICPKCNNRNCAQN